MLTVSASAVGWAAEVEPDASTPNAHRTDRATDRTVTLLTGDRVTLRGGDTKQVSIAPGKGRQQMKFRHLKAGDKFYVIPADVARLVASGKVDRRLFDVTGLVQAGYDDSRTKATPLIVTYDGATGRAAARSAGATTTRELPAINGAAVKVAKGTDFMSELASDGQRLAGGVEKVWLDGKRHTTLDQSVPQIGAPAAWQAGYTGTGTTVAVLDTGIDATHPDLADRVAEAKNFTADSSDDEVGHGTHVASTIAGTAAASSGKYKGVAPDAKLLDGKVCELFGCPESVILAGMQWAAAEKKADVINLSLGGGDGPEIDPLEEAVNTLTQQTGSLFVIAAGNSGPRAKSVGSPGSADAALTVGAVDQQDKIAGFSSRGPRVGDGAVKPDVTAPGVDIVAANSKDGFLGKPGEAYTTLSGTSMATPHTAGAAAILAQQHPDWDADEIKGALMASAKVHPDQGVYDQGAGRIDVAKAITQTVVTDPGSLSFGTARWPHDDDVPVTKQITYRNLGTSPVTLNLQATLNGPNGRPAPAGAFSLSATSVTVPAGGTATVSATSNTKHDGPDGGYSGRLTATGAGVSLPTPIGLDKEVESYDVDVTHRGPDGNPTGMADTIFVGLDNDNVVFAFEEDGTAQVRLPKGRYYVDGLVSRERPGDLFDIYHLVQPSFTLERDSAFEMDARVTKEVTLTVPRADAELVIVDTGLTVPSPLGTISGGVFGLNGWGLFTAPLGEPAEGVVAHVGSTFAKPGVNTPYTYNTNNTQPGKYFHGFHRDVRAADLARLTSRFNASADKHQADHALAGLAPGQGNSVTIGTLHDAPGQVTHYLDAGDIEWYGFYADLMTDDDGGLILVGDLRSTGRTFQAGRSYAERWNAVVFGSRFATDFYAFRFGDTMLVDVPMYSDQDGHRGYSATDTAVSKLYRNGVLVSESDLDAFIAAEDLPGEKADYTVVSTATRPSFSKFSTRTEASWKFSSQTAPEEGEMLPLWAVRFLPNVDRQNTVARTRNTTLPVTLEVQPSAMAGKLRQVEILVSGDDGRTWTKATVRRTGTDRYAATFPTPTGGFVSLKAKAADSNGNTTQQTITRAYAPR